MTLYHGTNTDFDTINLEEGFRFKDFGKGFYQTMPYRMRKGNCMYIVPHICMNY